MAGGDGRYCVRLIEALELLKQDVPEGEPPLRVFLACGFTPLHLQTFLSANLRKCFPRRRVQLEVGLFGDLAGNLERLDSSNYNAVTVVVEWEDLDPRLGIRSLGGWRSSSLPDIVSSAAKKVERLKNAVARISNSFPVICCMPTLPMPPMFPSRPQRSSTFELQIRQHAASFAASICEQLSALVLNTQTLEELSPPSERFDLTSVLMTGFPYTLAHASVVGQLLAGLIQNSPPKKGLITDLDETLWSGILGEVGVGGISWSLDEHSQMHGLYQQLLASLASTGVLIGVASKNDPALAEQAFQRKDCLLSRDEMFPIEVHWMRKSESVRRILKIWNVGPDSVVFVDDSPMEVAEVKSVFPEMVCLTFPTAEPQAIWALLCELRDLFGKDLVSQEDSIRLRSIRTAQSLRESLDSLGPSVDEFLASAKASLVFEFGKQAKDTRSFELVNKTNQFNLNGKRFDEAAWAAYLRNPSSFLVSVAYEDKYGTLGKIAVLMGTSEGMTVKVDVWVMSCRAFSRRIEHQCLKYLFEKFGAIEITFDYRATARNGPLQEFFTQLTGSPPSPDLKISRLMFFEGAPDLFHAVEEINHA
jgi:FkbH-like protein